jgi:Protein of unknown function (DUF5672)
MEAGKKNLNHNQHKKNLVAVVIPAYKETLSEFEQISLQQCENILKSYPKILIAPYDLSLDIYSKILNGASVINFDKEYFEGFKGYNKLMLSQEFYKSFIDYEYILIHQTDVFIFKDELEDWCEKNYDYIGAPWYRETAKAFIYIAQKNSILRALKLVLTKNLNYRAGNGGLSLRKIQPAIECLKLQERITKNWEINEDYFWSFFSLSAKGEFKIPKFKEALKFAIEKKPRNAFMLNNSQLPFGVHAWDKWDLEFWRPFIEQYGYSLLDDNI